MKEVLLLICTVIAYIDAQAQCGCGCSLTPRPLPLCPRPPPPQRPLRPRPTPCSPPSRPLVPICPRPLPPCPCTCEVPTPIVEVCDYNQAVIPFIQAPLQAPILQKPIVSYEVSPYSVALPSCNCPAPPSPPVSQLYSSFSPVIPNYVLNSGLGIFPCSEGVVDLSPVLSPLGLINPFLPAASPISALAPTVSSLYPPINPCGCRCQYLKKIPIPPPCI